MNNKISKDTYPKNCDVPTVQTGNIASVGMTMVGTVAIVVMGELKMKRKVRNE